MNVYYIAMVVVVSVVVDTVFSMFVMNDLKREGQTFTVAGWGTLSSGGDAPDEAQAVDVPFIPYADCVGNESEYAATDIYEEVMICAGDLDSGGIDSCQGDSGGPLFVDCEDRKPVLVGVVSWGIGCASEGYPGVYANVSAFHDFLYSVMDGTTTVPYKNVSHDGSSSADYDYEYYEYYEWDYDYSYSHETSIAPVQTTMKTITDSGVCEALSAEGECASSRIVGGIDVCPPFR